MILFFIVFYTFWGQKSDPPKISKKWSEIILTGLKFKSPYLRTHMIYLQNKGIIVLLLKQAFHQYIIVWGLMQK